MKKKSFNAFQSLFSVLVEPCEGLWLRTTAVDRHGTQLLPNAPTALETLLQFQLQLPLAFSFIRL